MLPRWPQVATTLLVVSLLTGSCQRSEPTTATERGRRIYLAACTTCHNPDPTLPGGSGPEIAGSSRELIEARVLRAEYPPGYHPKRASKAMLPLPQFAPYIDDISAFLGEPHGAESDTVVTPSPPRSSP